MGKAYKARAAEGYYNQFLEILYYVYIHIFPRLAKKSTLFRSQYKIIIINHNKL